MSDVRPELDPSPDTGPGAHDPVQGPVESEVVTSTPTRDLNLFEDQEKRGRQAGSFSSPSNHLDHVDLNTRPQHQPATSSFGAPRLDDAELHRKVDVCSEVLRVIAQAIAESGLETSRQVWLTLLFEGSPAAFAPLFSGIHVRPDGHIDAAVVAKNVRQRPPAEHRSLLNEGLLDLMERALARCTDELPDPVADRVLVQVAGYRKRIGL